MDENLLHMSEALGLVSRIKTQSETVCIFEAAFVSMENGVCAKHFY